MGDVGSPFPQPPRRVVSAEEVTRDYRRAHGIFVLIKVSCRVLRGLYRYDVYVAMAGLYSCGLYSYGLYGSGLYSCGLHSYGLYRWPA